MVKIHKKIILAAGIVSVAAAMIALLVYPTYTATAEYQYVLNQEDWTLAEETTSNIDATASSLLTIEINARGYAFLRIDDETIKQCNCTTNIVVQVQPATESTKRKIDITGLVEINDTTYKITGGKVFVEKEKKLFFLNCTGTDENGNQITLKFGAKYFWWGGKAYALRSKSVLQTLDKPMLLLQRGIAKIS